ncbi:MAG: VIT domain-containing protein [bacterium]|nr:VIT domain-containing protein [bacterium]
MQSRLTIPTILFISITSIAVFLGTSTTAHAQGIIIEPDRIIGWIPPQPIGPWEPQPITVQRETIQIDLDDQFAHVKISQTFQNNTGIDLEGTYIFPLPPGADISDFALWMDGRQLASETLPADEASAIYHQIVASMRDPGLLEYMGDGLIQAWVYPIPAYGTKQIDMEYDWLITMDGGLMELDLPMKLDGYSIDQIQSLAVTVNIISPDTLGTIYSPTHDVRIDHHGEFEATASFEESNYRPEGNFVLYVSRPQAAVGVNMLTHATGTDEGYFLTMIAPEYKETGEVIPKDFVCVLDTSGSMAGGKIEQAKEALNFIFQNLNGDDRFQLITFATDVYPYYEGWSDATTGNIADVRGYIEGIDAGGSTNIDEAMREALRQSPDRNRPMYVIFMTDGLPTVGETNTAMIVENINAVNSEVNGRIFCFGVGDDVDYQFIDRLSRENGGYTESVGPNENMEQPLSDFYAKIKSPVMTGIEVEITGARIYDMLPETMPDLFLGSQLILAGRFVGTGNGEIVLTGTVGGEAKRFAYPVEFTNDRENDFIPRHWATRRVGYLLNQIRLYGENQEVVDEIVDLATRYGIITPYTSMLVTEDEMPQPTIFGWSPGGVGLGAPPQAESSARAQSSDMSAMEQSGVTNLDQNLEGAVSYAGDKTFYMNIDGYWVDSEYDEDTMDEPEHIVYLSDEYFNLIADEPDIADYLAVGEMVIVVFGDKVYKIDSEE